MKYIGKNKSKNDIDIFVFSFGKPELILLLDIFSDIHKKTPRSLFTQPFTSRLDAIRRELMKTMVNEGIKYPIRRSDYKLSKGEIF